MENKTQKLKEVKAYFKNAKEVRCLSDNKIYNVENIKRDFHFFYRDIWIGTFKDAILVFDNTTNKYAEIISYKDENIGQFKKDSIVESVINQFKERSEIGIKKYNTTLDRTDLNTLDWINHAQQEAMDFVLYLEKLKKEYENNGNA